MRRSVPVSAAAALVVALLLGTSPVAAECSGSNPWPCFAQAAPRAYRIVIADVAAITERARNRIPVAYRLDVVERVMGISPDVIDLERIWAIGTIPCRVRAYLYLEPGDRIAVAWGFPRADGVRGPASAVAIIRGRLDPERMPAMQRFSATQIRALAELPPTDAITEQAPVGPATPFATAATLLASILGALWFMRRRAVVAGSRKRPGTSGVP